MEFKNNVKQWITLKHVGISCHYEVIIPPINKELSFDEFLRVDEDVIVTEYPTDYEILCWVNDEYGKA